MQESNRPERNGPAVIVTGAARGLGRAMARGLLQSGRRVAAIDLPGTESLLDSIDDSGNGGALRAITADITDAAACQAAIEQIVEAFGTPAALINNAGRGMDLVTKYVTSAPKPFFEVDPAIWRSIVDTNVNGTFLMTRAVVPFLIAAGGGSIINVVTSYPTMIRAGFSPYGPTKAALESMTAIWAQDLRQYRIDVNAVLPGGPADTGMIPREDISDRASLIAPEVMIAPVVWLCTPESKGVTGRRFIGALWDASMPAQQAAKIASTPAGWQTD